MLQKRKADRAERFLKDEWQCQHVNWDKISYWREGPEKWHDINGEQYVVLYGCSMGYLWGYGWRKRPKRPAM